MRRFGGLILTRSTAWSHTIELPVDARSASDARRFVALHLAEHDLSDLIDDVQLVVSELATNALQHANTPFTVSVTALERSVLVMVVDGDTAEPVLLAHRDLDLGGRGIRLVEALSRSWGVSADAGGGKSVWAVFDIASPAPLP